MKDKDERRIKNLLCMHQYSYSGRYEDTNLGGMGEPLSPNTYFSLQIDKKLSEQKKRIDRMKYAVRLFKEGINRIKKKLQKNSQETKG